MKTFYPGSKAIVYNNLTDKHEPCEIVCWYGFRSEYNKSWIYKNCIDVIFDSNKARISKGHFTTFL